MMRYTHEKTRSKVSRGFTLIELLVVISVIALLITLLLPALGRARDSARQIKSQSGLRQMMVGYSAHTVDHKGEVLYGLTPPIIDGKAVEVRAGGRDFGFPVADRYPWRLAPYVGGVWEILYSHAEVPPLPTEADTESDALIKAYNLSISPTYGMNSIYVGGHGTGQFKGFITDSTGRVMPNRGAHVVFRDSEVRRPSSLIVFSDSKQRIPGLPETDTGMYFVTPPRARGHRWQSEGNEIENLMPSSIAGLPEGYYSKAAAVSFFDGHVEARLPDDLEDMRLWANHAESEDDPGFTP